jgi:hypothetical protein
VENENYWQNELSSLGIELKQENKLNDKGELRTLAMAIKELYFQAYKTAYNDSHTKIDKSHLE